MPRNPSTHQMRSAAAPNKKNYIATNFLGHGTVNPKANESDD
jgi:hypothetical protein